MTDSITWFELRRNSNLMESFSPATASQVARCELISKEVTEDEDSHSQLPCSSLVPQRNG